MEVKVTEMIRGHFVIAAVLDDRGWSIFGTYRNILGWREAGNSLGCLQQREVVHTHFPACSIPPLCRADGKMSALVFAELKFSLVNTNA